MMRSDFRSDLDKGNRSTTRLTSVFLLLAALIFISPPDSEAIPAFAREIGRDCSFCHFAVPRLNETGRIYKSQGYRFEDDGEWREVKEFRKMPLALEVELEALYNSTKSGGVEDRATDIKVEEVEVLAATSMGKTGKVSAFTAFALITGTGTGGETIYEAEIGHATLQVNDIIGHVGAGLLNIQAGKGGIGLPFLVPEHPIIHNGYQSEKTLGLFSTGESLIEINGTVIGEEETLEPTHRYSLGLTRENINSDHKLSGIYGTYALTVGEIYHLGLVYRGGKVKGTGVDIAYKRYGLGGSYDADGIVLTGGYFINDENSTDRMTNYLIEVFFRAGRGLLIGGRYDIVSVTNLTSARAATLMARLDITKSVFLQAELRNLDDKDTITGTNEEEKKGRLFLVAIF